MIVARDNNRGASVLSAGVSYIISSFMSCILVLDILYTVPVGPITALHSADLSPITLPPTCSVLPWRTAFKCMIYSTMSEAELKQQQNKAAILDFTNSTLLLLTNYLKYPREM